jgi:hypothetical protein
MVATVQGHAERMLLLREALRNLHKGYFATASLILGLLHRVSLSEPAKMSAPALAAIFVDFFLRPSFYVFYRESDRGILPMIMEWMITEYEYLFREATAVAGLHEGHEFKQPPLAASVRRAPAMPRQPSIRHNDIVTNNVNRRPIYFMQQAKLQKEVQDSQETSCGDTEGTGVSSPTASAPLLEVEPEDLIPLSPRDAQEAEVKEEGADFTEEEEDTYNEEESRKTDEMMGVIDELEESIVESSPFDEPSLAEEVQPDPSEEEVNSMLQRKGKKALFSPTSNLAGTQKNSNPMLHISGNETEGVTDAQDSSQSVSNEQLEERKEALQFEEVYVEAEVTLEDTL